MIKLTYNLFAVVVLLLWGSTSQAGEVQIIDVRAHQSKDEVWHFTVTLKHADTGWDHYANEWQVIAPDNKILATRTLYHPHVNEQPFARSISGVSVPASMTSVRVIAKDTVHGLAKAAIRVNLSTGELTPVKLELK